RAHQVVGRKRVSLEVLPELTGGRDRRDADLPIGRILMRREMQKTCQPGDPTRLLVPPLLDSPETAIIDEFMFDSLVIGRPAVPARPGKHQVWQVLIFCLAQPRLREAIDERAIRRPDQWSRRHGTRRS